MTGAASMHLELRDGPVVGPPLRRTIFVVCAAAFFVLAYGSATTWGRVQEEQESGFTAELDAMAKGNASGNPYRQAAGLALGAIGACALVSRRGARLRARGPLAWAVLAYVAANVVSIAWADDPQLTFRRVVAFVMMALAVAGVVRALPRSAIVSFALFASAAYVLVAVAAELAGGAFRPFSVGYRLSGVFHPNTVGAFCVVLVTAATSSGRPGAPPWLRGATVAFGVAVLLLARSRASLLGLLLALGARWMVAARPWRRILALGATAWLACGAYVLWGDALGPALEKAFLMSRQDSQVETLSGRTALWDELLHRTAEHPLLGYGLGSFWSARRVNELYASQHWPVAEAHSTYIEQLLDLGAAGLVLYVAAMALGVARAARRLRVTGDPAYGFMLCVLVFFAVTGSLETMQHPSFPTFLLFWSLASLGLRAHRPAARRALPCAST